jgi:hypothetical protein
MWSWTRIEPALAREKAAERGNPWITVRPRLLFVFVISNEQRRKWLMCRIVLHFCIR